MIVVALQYNQLVFSVKTTEWQRQLFIRKCEKYFLQELLEIKTGMKSDSE